MTAADEHLGLQPYTEAAPGLLRAGWQPLPLPRGTKWPPPTGFTGADGRIVAREDVERWLVEHPDGNVATRLPANVIGIDVDRYKDGGETLARLESEHGPLPPTVVVTSRTDGSGIRLFRLPEGASTVGMRTGWPGIEVIRAGHRYVVTAPSIHPDGWRYRVEDQRTGEIGDLLPPPADLPEIPAAWLAAAAKPAPAPRTVTVAPVGPGRTVDPWNPCQAMQTRLSAAHARLSGGEARHDVATAEAFALLRLGEMGHDGASAALASLGQSFRTAVAGDRAGGRGEAQREWDSIVATAATKVSLDPTPDADKRCCGPTGPLLGPGASLAQVLAGGRVTAASLAHPSTFQRAAPGAGSAATDSADGLEEADETAEVIDLAFRQDVARRAWDLRVAREAKRVLAAETAGEWDDPEFLTAAMLAQEPDEDEAYRVDGVWPLGGNVLIAAGAKTGKTTLALNIVRSLITGEPFLGEHAVETPAGRVCLLDLELSRRQLRRWLRAIGIAEDRVLVINARGKGGVFASAVTDPDTRARFGAWLRSHEVEVLVVDPVAALLAGAGLDENSNSDVGEFLRAGIDALALEAGVAEVLVIHHAGHGGERSRGASALLDWPDAIWTYTKADPVAPGDEDSELAAVLADAAEPRFLRVIGRDCDLPETRLDYDPVTHLLSRAVGGGSRAQARARAGEVAQEVKVLAALRALGDGEHGINAIAKTGLAPHRRNIRDAAKRLAEAGKVIIREGDNNTFFVRSSQVVPVVPSGAGTTGTAGGAPLYKGTTGTTPRHHPYEEDEVAPPRAALTAPDSPIFGTTLPACAGCGLPSVTSPCTACRRGAS